MFVCCYNNIATNIHSLIRTLGYKVVFFSVVSPNLARESSGRGQNVPVFSDVTDEERLTMPHHLSILADTLGQSCNGPPTIT